jgi:electron transfer flavoprotein beta subunit
MSVVPSMVAERLDVNQATFAGALSVDGATVSITREGDAATEHVSAALPAVVSITDQTDEARYPAFRAIMMAKKKPIETLSLADIGVESGSVGLAAAATRVVSVAPAPARSTGTVVVDDGTGAAQLADFLVAQGSL